MFEEMGGGCRFPEKLVHTPRTAVAQQHTILAQLQPKLRGKLFHPLPICRIGVGEGIGVAEAGKMVIARVGVAALAVGELVYDGIIVVDLTAMEYVLEKQRR